MEYDTDTLTNAMRNRAASRKFFQQWQLPPRANHYPAGHGNQHHHQQANQQQFSSHQNNNSQAFMAFQFHQNDLPPMLHRSPSGAQRKIKQRREEKCQQQQRLVQQKTTNNGLGGYTAGSNNNTFSSTSSSNFVSSTSNLSSSSSTTSVFQKASYSGGSQTSIQERVIREEDFRNYRSLRESNDFKSILPEDDLDDNDYMLPKSRLTKELVREPSSSPEYTGISLINTFEKPEPPERTRLPTSNSNLASTNGNISTSAPSHRHQGSFEAEPKVQFKEIEKIETKTSSVASPTIASITNHFGHITLSNSNSNFSTGKPTVEVHPMPAPRINSLPPSVSPPDTLKKQPPPVPKKPAKLRRKFETVIGSNGDESERENRNMAASTPSNGTLNSSFSSSSSSLAKPHMTAPTTLFTFASVSAAPSTESLHLLCASPSLVSLQNGLHHAYSNPQEYSREQLEELEKRRLQSIESLSKKVANREQDRDMVDEEIQSNDQLRSEIFAAIANHKSLVSRLDIHLLQGVRLVQLETRLQLQLEKLESANVNPEDADYVVARKRRTMEQLQDTKLLRSSHDNREAELEQELHQLLNEEQMQVWNFYKITAAKLHAERKQIEDRLGHVKAQLRSLLAMEPIVVADQQDSPTIEKFKNMIQEPSYGIGDEEHDGTIISMIARLMVLFLASLKFDRILEVGDIENWSKIMEADMLVISETLQEAYSQKTKNQETRATQDQA